MDERKEHLPQLRVDDAVYFVTWRLNARQDSLAPAERDVVAETLDLFNESRYRLAAYVVMDDHVHVVVFPFPDHSLGSILHSWKSFTSKAINKLRETSGTRWMKDNHTRIIRSRRELLACVQYVMDNPVKRWPEVTDYKWLKLFDVL